jgi:hypothetical protein
MSDEARLIEKLKRIEALFAGAATQGERAAAANAMQRIRGRLKELHKTDPPTEFKFRLADMWSRRLLVALLRRYGIRPYRYPRQKRTTVMAKVPERFVEETLWPEFRELDNTLRTYLDEITDRVIREGIYSDTSEAEIMKESIEG